MQISQVQPQHATEKLHHANYLNNNPKEIFLIYKKHKNYKRIKGNSKNTWNEMIKCRKDKTS
jgi:hypothetical protein